MVVGVGDRSISLDTLHGFALPVAGEVDPLLAQDTLLDEGTPQATDHGPLPCQPGEALPVPPVGGSDSVGKSTLLTMVGRLQKPDTGAITVGGEDVFTTPSGEVAKKLSILRQENHFVTRLTVRQLVGFGRYPHSHGRLNVEDEKHITEAIDFLNLTDLDNRYLDQLSGGQRQRAYVAMVLAQDTDYVLLDEPLNNLDMKHSVQMMKQLRRACDELGRTVVIVLHDINFAARYADHICAMADGQVTVFGTPEEVIRDEVLSGIFGTPVKVLQTEDGPLASYF